MKILIRNGRVIDPARNFDEICDVAIAAGRVISVGRAPEGFAANRTLDASGCIVAPGLVDLAVRLREPGHEHEGMPDRVLEAQTFPDVENHTHRVKEAARCQESGNPACRPPRRKRGPASCWAARPPRGRPAAGPAVTRAAHRD